MTQPEELFHQIIIDIPEAIEGKMFGANCIKLINGKVVTIFWKDNMLFKLPENELNEALALEGAAIGSHLYAPDKPMKSWVMVPTSHSNKWNELALKAIEYAKALGK